MALSPQFMSGVGEAMKDLLLANVCAAVAGVDINIFGFDIHPFGFLQQWANNLTAAANNALANAANAQNAANNAQSTANSALAVANGKPGITQIPISSQLWGTINNDEDSTFPRSQLSFGAASNTSTGGTSTAQAHVHPLSTVPDYQPAGHGANLLEIAYIRATRDRQYTTIGFITGGSATWAGITAAYVGIYSVNPTTGDLTLLNTTTASYDISGSITTQNTEQRFSMGYTINAHQNDVFAVGILQVTSLVQTCASLMKTTLTDMNPPVTQFPRKNYCYSGGYGSIPSSITESNLNYSASTKLPFYVLR